MWHPREESAEAMQSQTVPRGQKSRRPAHLRVDGVLVLGDDGAVEGAADVAEQLLVAVGRAPREQAAAVDGAQRRDALAARVQLPKPCQFTTTLSHTPGRRQQCSQGGPPREEQTAGLNDMCPALCSSCEMVAQEGYGGLGMGSQIDRIRMWTGSYLEASWPRPGGPAGWRSWGRPR